MESARPRAPFTGRQRVGAAMEGRAQSATGGGEETPAVLPSFPRPFPGVGGEGATFAGIGRWTVRRKTVRASY